LPVAASSVWVLFYKDSVCVQLVQMFLFVKCVSENGESFGNKHFLFSDLLFGTRKIVFRGHFFVVYKFIMVLINKVD